MKLYQRRKQAIYSWVKARRAPWSSGQLARALNLDRQIVDYHMPRMGNVERVGDLWARRPRKNGNPKAR